MPKNSIYSIVMRVFFSPKFGYMKSALALQSNSDIPEFLSGCLQRSPLGLQSSKYGTSFFVPAIITCFTAYPPTRH